LQELELVKQENSQLSSYKRQVLMLDQETLVSLGCIRRRIGDCCNRSWMIS
jgi:hypothetical protein